MEVNKVSERKRTLRSKLNAARRLQKMKEIFKNLLGNLPEISDNPTKIINWQLDIKRELFTKEKKQHLKISKAKKLHASTKYFLKHGRQGDLKTFFFYYASLCINTIQYITLSAGAVEYTDCFSAEG